MDGTSGCEVRFLIDRRPLRNSDEAAASREFPSLTKQVYCTPVLVASTPCIWKQTGYHTKVYIGENLPNRLGRLLDSMVGVNQGTSSGVQPSTVLIALIGAGNAHIMLSNHTLRISDFTLPRPA